MIQESDACLPSLLCGLPFLRALFVFEIWQSIQMEQAFPSALRDLGCSIPGRFNLVSCRRLFLTKFIIKFQLLFGDVFPFRLVVRRDLFLYTNVPSLPVRDTCVEAFVCH